MTALLRGLGCLFAVCLLAHTAAMAQNLKFAEDPVQFMSEFRNLMDNSRNSAYIQASKDLEAVWETGLNQTQRLQFISLIRNLASKGQKAGPVFYLIMRNLQTVISSQGDVNGFMISMDHAASQYDGKTFLKIQETSQLVLEKKLLYRSNFNKLYLTSGQYRFRYEEPVAQTPENAANASWDTPADSLVFNNEPLPVVSGVLLDLQHATFAMVAGGDSVLFGPSTGSVSLKDGIFVGKEGRFSWASAGDSAVYVDLGDYSFRINAPALKAAPVVLNDHRLGRPLQGIFEYKSAKRPPGKPSSGFPRFMSLGNDADLKAYTGTIRYKGGYTLQGHELFSTSVSGEPAEVAVFFEEKPAFKASSSRFSLMDSVITAPLASFSMPLGQDSLTHPGVVFRYNDDEGYLHLGKHSKSDFSALPYTDTYHKVAIWAESARWKLADGNFQLYMVTGKTEVPLRVESLDFFRKSRFNALTQEFGFQPLLLAAGYMQQQKKQTVHPSELAAAARKSPEVIRRMLERLTLDGYFDYHPDLDAYSISRKGVFYIMANVGKADFDNLTINSTFPSNATITNASISLKDTLLTIRGVERFIVSDSLRITGNPSDRILVMGKNRDFTINGRLQSANFKFTGRNLKFHYDDFFINMTDMDSITYIPRENYVKGLGGEVGGSVQYKNAGTFYLSDSKNKSGQQKGASGSPRILIPDGITVYFNQPERGPWAYPEEVNFKVPKLDVGGLDKKDIEFVGDFNSDGIVPPLKTTLKSMPDNSLGFEYPVPAAGIKIYNGLATAKFPEKLLMDNSGLHGKGNLTFLAATLDTENMVLTADSLLAAGPQAAIRETTIGNGYFPKVDLKDYTMSWFPKADSMLLRTQGDAFSFYNHTTHLDGGLLLRSTGLYGQGILKRADSELSSNEIGFKKEGFVATDAAIRIYSGNTDPAAAILHGKGVDVDFNIVNGLVAIKKKASGFDQDSSYFELPQANYFTTIDEASWNTKTKTVTMKGTSGTALFKSLIPEQEGLEFHGTGGIYAIDKKTLSVSGVPFVQSAGLKIIPDKGLVNVDENGNFQPFTKARIEVDTLDVSHRMSDADIRIFSRNRLEGSATYQYITAQKDTFAIKMGSFELHEFSEQQQAGRKGKAPNGAAPNYYTTALADISEEDKLMLAPGIAYKGAIQFTSYLPSLQLDGMIRPLLKHRPNLSASWILYKETPGVNLSLTVDKQLKNEDNIALFAGLHYKAGGGIYPTFLSYKEDDRDPDFLAVEGIMQYNSEAKTFDILRNPGSDSLSPSVPILSFDDAGGVMTFTGKLGLSSWATAAGVGEAQIDSMRITVNTLLGLNLPALEPVQPELAAKIVETNLEEHNSDPAEDDLQRLFAKLEALIGVNETKVYADKLAAEYKPLSVASPSLDLPMVLSNVTLHWSQLHNAFYSSGLIGMANLGKHDINAQMEGMLEIRKTDQGDEFSLYLEVTPELWYFFDLAHNQLGVVSSSQDFNDLVVARSRTVRSRDMGLLPLGPEDKTLFVDRYYTTYQPDLPRKPREARKKTTGKPKQATKKAEESEGF